MYRDRQGKLRWNTHGKRTGLSLNVPVCSKCRGFLPDLIPPVPAAALAGQWERPKTCHHCGADLTQPGALL